jgi:DNA repair protein RadA/Sms
MSKQRTVFICQECGSGSPKWLGRCPSCQAWNSLVEEISETRQEREKPVWKSVTASGKPKSIPSIVFEREPRLVTGDSELDRVLGGGIVPGSLILIGGEPGIGKSTLMLQVAMAMTDHRVLYVSGEESESQIKLRAERMESTGENCYVLAETFTDSIFRHSEDLQPHLIIIDSVQTLQSPLLESSPGSIGQVRQTASEMMKYAKETGIPVFLIGHITKDGSIAGPKTLEHMVDTVIQFEGDRHTTYRILRTSKNRFGNTSELGIYEMQSYGLRQVSNPSELLIPQREGPVSGVVIGSMLEGNRPLKIEIQSLVSVATYGTPQRTSNGYETRRLQMLLAVLEKRGGYKFGVQDVFLNVAGGLRVEDPAIDLAVAVSLFSSYEDLAIPMDSCFVGEVGLGGEIRAVSRVEARINEAAKLGFKRMYISRYNLKDKTISFPQGLEVRTVRTLEDLFLLLESGD